MSDFKNLVVWQKALALSIATVEHVENVTGNAGAIIRNQVLRSVFSIQNNVAEGSGKKGDREFARFVRIAMGSGTESENHFILLKELALIDEAAFNKLNEQLDEVAKMLVGLQRKLTNDADEA